MHRAIELFRHTVAFLCEVVKFLSLTFPQGVRFTHTILALTTFIGWRGVTWGTRRITPIALTVIIGDLFNDNIFRARSQRAIHPYLIHTGYYFCFVCGKGSFILVVEKSSSTAVCLFLINRKEVVCWLACYIWSCSLKLDIISIFDRLLRVFIIHRYFLDQYLRRSWLLAYFNLITFHLESKLLINKIITE